jgi:hypothetical protein
MLQGRPGLLLAEPLGAGAPVAGEDALAALARFQRRLEAKKREIDAAHRRVGLQAAATVEVCHGSHLPRTLQSPAAAVPAMTRKASQSLSSRSAQETSVLVPCWCCAPDLACRARPFGIPRCGRGR